MREKYQDWNPGMKLKVVEVLRDKGRKRESLALVSFGFDLVGKD